MKIYDDAEGMLQDQGLEVVVIPYRPPPPLHQNQKQEKPRSGSSRNRKIVDPLTDLSKPIVSLDAEFCVGEGSTMELGHNKQDPYNQNIDPETKLLACGSRSPRPEFAIPDIDGTSAPMHLVTPRSQLVLNEATEENRNKLLEPGDQSEMFRNSHAPLQPKLVQHQQHKANQKQHVNFSVEKGYTNDANDKGVFNRDNKAQIYRSKSSSTSSSTNSFTSQRAIKQAQNAQKPNQFRINSRQNNSSNQQKRSQNCRSRASYEKMGYIQMAKLGYQELVHAIIRPPRSKYPSEALGPKEFTFCGLNFRRRDFELVNDRGLRIEVSRWKRVYDDEIGDYEDEERQKSLGRVGEEYSCKGDEVELDRLVQKSVDDWDENVEKGKLYLQVAESSTASEDSTSSSSSLSSSEGFSKESGRRKSDDCENMPETVSRSEKQQCKPQNKTVHINCSSESFPSAHSKTTNARRKRRRHPVVIYLHGNSSARFEVVPQLGHLLSLGVIVVAFDFAGSGRSEGEHVSLGYYEREDLQTVVMHLRASGDVSTIGIWGRSMGAATALMYGSRDPTISCMILDSPFTDLTRLSEEMVEKGRQQGVAVPNFVLSVVMKMIKSSVKHQAGFNIKHISPISHASRCFIPAMFVAGEHDSFINKHHSEMIHEKYAGDKNLVIVDGDHNSARPRYLLQSACLFLQSCMQIPASLELVVPLGANLLAPPWVISGSIVQTGPAISGRMWLPVESSHRQQGLQQQNQHLQNVDNQNKAIENMDNGASPPKLPFSNASQNETCVIVNDHKSESESDASALLAASAPPDMSERQKEIQLSLFKMLGQED